TSTGPLCNNCVTLFDNSAARPYRVGHVHFPGNNTLRKAVSMRRLLFAAILAALLLAPIAHAWTWPAAAPVLQPFRLDPERPCRGASDVRPPRPARRGATPGLPRSADVLAGAARRAGRAVADARADRGGADLPARGRRGAGTRPEHGGDARSGRRVSTGGG